ncbi:MAG: esterase family protein [Limnochordaceae bacterium]|nr:esterase family protein [Limnochordaceae bacterium]
MNLATVTFLSQSLGRHVTYTAILPNPQAGRGPYPVLYQLHGASDDHSGWLRLSNLVRHVSALPLVVILPEGALSFWLNYSPHERYEDFLMNDLPAHVQATFPIRTGRAATAIGGLSMGGFGALRLGLKFPDRFISVWGHSSGLWRPDDLAKRWPGQPPADPQDADIYYWAEQAAAWVRTDPQRLPTLSFDCGTEDFLLPQNREFHRFLTEHGIPHQYLEHPGSHTWDYWDLHVKDALKQHARLLGISQGQ